jgi:hypothetical protein
LCHEAKVAKKYILAKFGDEGARGEERTGEWESGRRGEIEVPKC